MPSLIFLPYSVIMEAAGVRLPVAPVRGWVAVVLGRGPPPFLCLDLAVPHDLRGFFGGLGVLNVRLNQLCDVLQVLIEFCARHLVHILPPFVRGWPPLPYSLILHYFVSLVKIYFTFFREI